MVAYIVQVPLSNIIKRVNSRRCVNNKRTNVHFLSAKCDLNQMREKIELENNKLTHRLHFIGYQLVVDSFFVALREILF